MKNLLAVIGDGNAEPVLEAALLVARRFNSHIVGLHSLTTEYAVVFGGEMGFSISSRWTARWNARDTSGATRRVGCSAIS